MGPALKMNDAIEESEETQGSADDRRRNRFVWLSEAAMVAVCVVVFFGFLSALIRAYFPQGTSLIVDRDSGAVNGASWSGDVELGINTDNAVIGKMFAGEIVSIQRRVQRRGANTLTWNDARAGDMVAQNDAVQTFARSSAVMEVNKDSQLTMGENSLIVFDQRHADPFLSDRNSVLVMIDGELTGSLSGADKSRFRFGVKLPNSDVTLQPRNAGEDVEFLITVNDDQSTTINVHEGTAQVIGRDGDRKTIGDQESLTVDPSGSEYRVGALSRAPNATGPANGLTVMYRNVPQQIHFTWSAVADADRYHIVIARDPAFSDRVVDDDVIDTAFVHGALGPGTYYWHVRSRIGWSQSEHSTVRRLVVAQDLLPPTLVMDPPPDTIPAGTWRLQGRTDADATVFVDEVPVTHQGGRIDHPVELRPGANVIVVKAVDSVGNLSYAPLLLNAK